MAEHPTRYYWYVTPLWDAARGARLKLRRMFMGKTQTQFGQDLGVSQRIIHALETGHMGVCKHFTLAQLSNASEGGLDFILFGTGAKDYDEREIHRAYWERNLKRKNARKLMRDP